VDEVVPSTLVALVGLGLRGQALDIAQLVERRQSGFGTACFCVGLAEVPIMMSLDRCHLFAHLPRYDFVSVIRRDDLLI
jgi:hypothetical protein